MKYLASILLMVLSPIAQAATYVDINLASYHFQRSEVARKNLSEFNPGIGIERDVGGWRGMAGVYQNSFRRDSWYALLGYTPLHIGGADVGVLGGAISGYASGAVPAVGLLASIGCLNLIVIPKAHIMHKDINGFVGFQVRVKY